MKKAFLWTAALIALATASCSKHKAITEPGPSIEVTVSIKGDAPGTRATGTTYADESRVTSLQVFVFNGDDREAYRSVRKDEQHPDANPMQALVPAQAGERTVWCIVNAPDLSSMMTIGTLTEEVSKLSDNAPDSFLMTGSVKQVLEDGGNVPVVVKRIVSRVSVAKISTAFKDYRAGYSVSIRGIYLINVAADNNYAVTGSASTWTNMLGHNEETYDALLADALSDVTVKNDSPYEKEHAFYPYPNSWGTNMENFGRNYSDTWSPRPSMLVIEAEVFDGEGHVIVLPNTESQTVGYYPIELPVLERNKTYSIEEVVITRLPGSKPYEPIETGETQVTITVADWELGLNLGTITI